MSPTVAFVEKFLGTKMTSKLLNYPSRRAYKKARDAGTIDAGRLAKADTAQYAITTLGPSVAKKWFAGDFRQPGHPDTVNAIRYSGEVGLKQARSTIDTFKRLYWSSSH